MIIDIIAAVLICYAFYRGFSKGLVNTVFDTLSILIGLVVALKFSPLVIQYLQEVINVNPSVEFIIGFIIVFFVVILLMRFIGERLEDLLRLANLNFLNQISGGVLAGLVVAFIMSAGLLLLSNLQILRPEYTATSTLYEHLMVINREGAWVIEKFKYLFADFWAAFSKTLDQIKDKVDQ